MSAAYYIVTQQEAGDIDVFVNGKAIAHLDEAVIENLCADAGVRSLLEFLSQSPEEFEEFLEDEGIELEEDGEFPEEEWFTPDEGLLTVRGLLTHLQKNTDALDNTADIIEDLLEYEAVLAQLAERSLAWHLALDY